MIQEQGQLVLRPTGANLTHDTDWVTRMSPYIVFKCGGQELKTKTDSGGGKNPKWANEEITFNTDTNGTASFEIYDYEMIGSNKPVATGSVSVKQVQGAGGRLNELLPLTWEERNCG